MQCAIFLGLVAIFSAASCKDLYPHHRDIKPAPQRYGVTKNKRGIEYPLGLTLGSPLQGLHPVPPVASPFAQGYSNFGGYSGGISNFAGGIPLSLNAAQFGAPAQQSSFSSLGAHSLGGLGGGYAQPSAFSGLGAQSLGGLAGGFGLGQPVLLGQGSSYNGPSSNLNLANLLGIQESASQPVSLRQFSSFDGRSSPISFASQGVLSAPSQQSYSPVFQPSPQIQPSTFSLPIGMASHQISNIQQVAPSHATLNNLGSHSVPTISLTPATSNNVVSYSTLSAGSNPPRDTSSHSSSGSYMIAAVAPPQQSSSPTNFRIPVSSIVSSSSSPSYTIASLTSPPGTQLQLATALSEHNRQPHRETLKIPESMGPSSSMVHSNSQSTSSGSPSSLVVNSPASPNSPDYPRNESGPMSSGSSGIVTSYGTPAMTYTIPSTSYGTPTHSHSIPNSSQNSQRESSPSLSLMSSMNNYSTLNPSSPFQVNSLKSPSSFSNSSPRFGPSSSSVSFSAPNFKEPQPSPPSGISNSIDTYSASPYEDGSDASSSYSSVSPRYTRYPVTRPSSYSETPEYVGSKSYDTISYSVPI